MFFGAHMLEVSYLIPTLVCFTAFCLLASSIYCLNDLIDADMDRMHPKKCKRPIASGTITPAFAYVMIVILLVAAVTIILLFFNIETAAKILIVFASYYVLNIAYCFRLKKFPIIDVFIISICFVLRVVAGGICTDIWISQWIVLMVFLLALFLSFAKRHDDLVIYEQTGKMTRKASMQYNLDFLNQVITIIGTITIVCYIMYSFSEEVILRFNSEHIYLTSIFVLGGIIRYLQITIVDNGSGNPTMILMKDHFIQIMLLLWILSFGAIIYL